MASEKFPGFDIAAYPGDPEMEWLWSHGIRISGYYLNHHRGGRDESWLSKAAVLTRHGWGLAPLYLGWQTVDNHGRPLPSPSDPESVGKLDAEEAVKLMAAANLPAGTVIYFDVENGAVPSGSYEQYLRFWRDAVRERDYVPAVYCSHYVISWAKTESLPCWSWNIPRDAPTSYDPTQIPDVPIDEGAIGTQFRQEVYLRGFSPKIDLSYFAIPDPSSGEALAPVNV